MNALIDLPAEIRLNICEFLCREDIYAFCQACHFSQVPPEYVRLCGGIESVFRWAVARYSRVEDMEINTLNMLFEKKKYEYSIIRIGGRPALLYAAITRNHAAVSLFIKNGFVVTSDSYNYHCGNMISLQLDVFQIALYGVVSVIEMMIDCFPAVKNVVWRYMERHMVPSGALESGPKAIECFLLMTPPKRHQKILSQGVSWIILHENICLTEKIKAVGLLLQQGANGYYPCGRTPLESAASRGYVEIVQLLVQEKYDPRQINQLLAQADPEDSDDDSPDHKKWELPIPKYIFPERARLFENFYGPEAENFEDDKLLARRIQTTKDMVALSKLCEPNRRGNRVNWNFDGDESEKSEEPWIHEEETLDCPTDVCIICYGLSRRSASNPPPHRFPPKRQDSLRRHLIDCHLANAHGGISCTWEVCRDVPKFAEITDFLAHSLYVHAYDIKIQPKHLPARHPVCRSEHSSLDDSEYLSESDRHSGIDTPASSISAEMATIDPRLLESDPAPATKFSLRRSKRIKMSL
ncbi:uncharacterized protein TRUGW13939_08764 [Talaromyces rugulosus]|uniref:Uncharacterized protein n=1 Tax=Talaromyces rugulosus TaxID=121627 RepID=A0A7H8R5H8_TALRU|nr:uncharacterized protein TRUGW13939_08764 [Talaromyces rugulosus]QKX61612.1 hypothetical protein TRUGW13939_08764 [Talaromyces rugulosus]